MRAMSTRSFSSSFPHALGETGAQRAERPQDGREGASTASNPAILLFMARAERKTLDSRLHGLRRQDAEANIRAANGPKGKLRMQRVNGELGKSPNLSR